MGRMPQEAPERESSLPHSREADGVVGIGVREESQCKQDFGVMADPLCGPGVTHGDGACVSAQGWCL